MPRKTSASNHFCYDAQGATIHDQEPQPAKLHTLGLLMGTSYQSSADYYTMINDYVNTKAGGLACAPMNMYNVNFATISDWMECGDWFSISQEIASAIQMSLHNGAEAFLICSNTLHYALDYYSLPFPYESSESSCPIIHIGDCVADAIKQKKLSRVALLGTKFTMSQTFMLDRLKKSGAEVYVPSEACQNEVDRIIFSELCLGKRKKASEQYLFKLIERLKSDYHIEGVVLGCTELEQLINHGVQRKFSDIIYAKDTSTPRIVFFESMKIHAQAAAKFVLFGDIPGGR